MKKDIGSHRSAMTTLFEKILTGDIPSHCVASGEGWYAFLDIFPRREGHTLVIPRRGVQRLADLSPEEQANLMEGVTRTQHVLGQRFETTDFTVCVHDGPLALPDGNGPIPDSSHGCFAPGEPATVERHRHQPR